ncbi:hypothetical protein [Hyphomonas atlantica]|uniref:HNH endonuclease n=1 Tax=Hyphomonas atlantica TaxID=1280948 RepID=A0A059DZ98_9PROT|nr:hypothetical protein [Hyphomonas atlantica]KCZ60299.1 hypothetical protein HY36_17575 [Hyphomonas atlantica]
MDDILSPEEMRRERDYKRLRTRNPICIHCGYHNHPAAMELAHIAPREFHDDGGVLCSNCHREVSDPEKDLPYAPQTQNPQIETIGRYLLALAEWFERIARTIAEFGAFLLALAERSPAIEDGVAT